MATLSKRATVYFDPDIHHALKIKAASTNSSLSELIDEAARLLLLEDQERPKEFADAGCAKNPLAHLSSAYR